MSNTNLFFACLGLVSLALGSWQIWRRRTIRINFKDTGSFLWLLYYLTGLVLVITTFGFSAN